MPPITRTAFRIFIAAQLLYPVIAYFNREQLPTISDEALPLLAMSVVVFFIPFFAMFAFVIYKAYRGRNWARLVLAALTACGTVFYFEKLVDQFGRGTLLAFVDAFLSLAQMLAVALLFTSSSNAWYRAQKEQHQEAAEAP